jgi:hypothetical protein
VTGCRAWDDCGWVWAPPPQLASGETPSTSLEAAGVPGLAPPGLLVATLALLGVGYTSLRRKP